MLLQPLIENISICVLPILIALTLREVVAVVVATVVVVAAAVVVAAVVVVVGRSAHTAHLGSHPGPFGLSYLIL